MEEKINYFSTHIFLADSQLLTFWHNAVNSLLSPPAVAKASVSKLALQKSHPFLYPTFMEYCYTQYITVFTFRRKVGKELNI